MASENRVDPWARIFKSSERGYFMGNRDYGDAWITCPLRHPDGSTGPSSVSYRKLFFLDEATALAAGAVVDVPGGEMDRGGHGVSSVETRTE